MILLANALIFLGLKMLVDCYFGKWQYQTFLQSCLVTFVYALLQVFLPSIWSQIISLFLIFIIQLWLEKDSFSSYLETWHMSLGLLLWWSLQQMLVYPNLHFTMSIIIVLSIMMLQFWSNLRFPQALKQLHLENQQRYLLMVVSCFFWIVSATIIYQFKNNAVSDQILLAIVTIFLIMINASCNYLTLNFLLRKDETMMLQNMQTESREFMHIVRAQRHDFNFHLHALSGLIMQKEYEACQQYLQKMIQDATEINDVMPLEDAAVGSLLLNYRKLAKKLNINFNIDIQNDLAQIACTPFETNKILGNLLINAFEAVKELSPQHNEVTLEIFKRRGNSVMIVTNAFDGNIEALNQAFNSGQSSKQGHEGLGLIAIKHIAKKYGGRFYFEVIDNHLRSIVNIPNIIITTNKEGHNDKNSNT